MSESQKRYPVAAKFEIKCTGNDELDDMLWEKFKLLSDEERLVRVLDQQKGNREAVIDLEELFKNG